MTVIETAKPTIEQPTDVLLKIASVGVCGSDMHYFNEGGIGSQRVEFPFTVGHEAAGYVEETGSEVPDLKKGDLVAIEPTIFCGECSECLNDRQHTCLNQRFLGSPGQAEGCLSEYLVLPGKCCFKVPDSMTPQLAAFAEPLSIGLYAVKLSEQTDPNLNIAILGVGPIGLTVLAGCLKQGQKNVYVTDILDYRVAFASKIGAKQALNPLKSGSEQALMESVEVGYDIVYDCCGKQEAIDQALRLLKPGGKLMIVGIPDTRYLSFNMDLMRRKEICVQNVRRQNNTFGEAIEMVHSDPSYFSRMITHNFPYSEAQKAFDTVAGYTDGVIKAMVNF